MTSKKTVLTNRWRVPTGLLCCLLFVAAWTGADVGAQEAVEGPSPERIKSAVDGGLEWLAEQQIKEGPDAGSWPAPSHTVKATSIAGLAFLAHGHLPGDEQYGDVLKRAMDYVSDQMNPEGYVGGDADSMYVHAYSSLFVLSYLGMSEEHERDEKLAKWGRRSVELILEAQQVRKRPFEQGGWRYSPYADVSDILMTSWQLVVLKAANQCGYHVPSTAFDEALRYVDTGFWEKEIEREEGENYWVHGFVYRPGVSTRAELGSTGAAIWVKSLLEKQKDERVGKAQSYLSGQSVSWGGEKYKGDYFVSLFYIVQGMFHGGGKDWHEFYADVQETLLEHQSGDGHWGFPPDDKKRSREAGPAWSTGMALLMLSLEEQYLPMFQEQKRLY